MKKAKPRKGTVAVSSRAVITMTERVIGSKIVN